MGSELPEIKEEQFRTRLWKSIPRLVLEGDGDGDGDARSVSAHSVPAHSAPAHSAPAHSAPTHSVSARSVEHLFQHYQELRRWNRRLSLVGPGTAGEVIGRHYGESLAALSLISGEDRSLVDVGSGAGFPGLILAMATEKLAVTLIEPRQKKWVFLETAARKAGLSCHCLNARVNGVLPAGLPDRIDVVTCRALRISSETFGQFFQHSPRLRFLLWYGEGVPEIPESLVIQRQWMIEGSDHRRILEIRNRQTSSR